VLLAMLLPALGFSLSRIEDRFCTCNLSERILLCAKAWVASTKDAPHQAFRYGSRRGRATMSAHKQPSGD